ncbi:helix-turn-helix domain-containing protein [Clostridium sp. HCP1S3_A12]|uniref:helix-turn-helix domain-containing protein n=1 Tax=unclassified Clostridium TaxID=2614128 RepID=UPI003F8BDFC0
MALNKAIKEIAKKKKISFYRISKNGGIAQTTLSEIVNGNNLNPTIETIQKIAKGLDVSASELISKAETKTKEK